MSSFFFDPTVEEQESSFSPIPAGVYIARVEDAEVKDTKSGGQRIALQFSIADGQFSNRRVFANINTRNHSQDAQRIGQSQLKAFSRAIGCVGATSTDPFLGKYCKIKVKIRKSDEYGDQNDVTGYEAIEQSAAPAASFKSQPPVQQASSVPWNQAR